MESLLQYTDAIYIYLIGILLFFSWYFFRKSQYDERRSKRFMLKNIKRRFEDTVSSFRNEKYDTFLRKYGFPQWLNSERINIARFSSLFLVIVIVSFGFLNRRATLEPMELMIWGLIPVLLVPKEKFPLHWIAVVINRNRQNHISNEVYQLYNDLKVSYQDQNTAKNSYYQIHELLPYYSLIRPTMEKMLPFLERKQKEEAWALFSNDLDIQEASMLSVVMQEVDSLKQEQATLLLEQKRQEFSNHLYNRYTDTLRRQKSFIFVLVVVGALSVFWNEVTIFFMWYREVMTVVNQFS